MGFGAAQAAQIDPTDFAQLKLTAQRQAMVPVVVDVELVSLEALQGTRHKAAIERRTAALLAELGANAEAGGPHWSNGIGQIELYVNERGLQVLKNSSNAVAFRVGKPWWQRTHIVDSVGYFPRMEAELASKGHVDVQVLPKVEELDFELNEQGRVQLSAKGLQQAQTAAAKLERSLEARHFKALALDDGPSALAKGAGLEGAMVKRLTRAGLAKLAQSGEVRNLLPLDLSDKRTLAVDPQALKQAEAEGMVEVIVNLRMPLFAAGLSKASMEAQTRSHRSALKDMLAKAGVDTASWQDFAGYGAMAGRLTAAQLKRLSSGADKRLLSVELVRPVATASLATATNMMNMNAAWSKGYRSAGQTIVVMDTGVQANHAFFRNAAGASRVTTEACFGTNAMVDGISYQSVCPNANANGDSPVGLAGSGAPVTSCSSANPDSCSHGTHVAGISAGRYAAGIAPTGVQGVAPDANIVGLQVFSFHAQRVRQPVAFNADLIAGLEATAAALGLVGATAAQPVTVNMSLGGGANSQPCGSSLPALTNAIAVLKAGGVPVVAANGNDDYSGQIGFPACVPGVVKVSAVANDGVGATRGYFGYDATANRHSGTNLPRPSNFSGEAIWVVAGGGNGTSIKSSVLSAAGTASYRGMSGTSQAAPQVAGLYAAVKAAVAMDPMQPPISVDGVSEWIRGNARVPTTLPMCGGGSSGPCAESLSFDRIRLPNL